MQSRVNGKKIGKTRVKSRCILESLEARCLLNGSEPWYEPEDLSGLMRPGYGIPDAFYSDPATWDEILLHDESMLAYDLPESGGTEETLPMAGPQPETAGALSILYLDFDGERVYSRSGDFWLGSAYVDIPAFDLGQYGWQGREQDAVSYITSYVQEDYAAYNVLVTNEEPAGGEYSTIYIGGTNDWFRPNSNVIGVATYDVGNRDASNYGFAFTEELTVYQSYAQGSLLYFSEYLSNLISHEAAHTYGSNHVSNTTALMNPYLPTRPRQSSFGSGTEQDTQTLLGYHLGYAHGPDDVGDVPANAQMVNGYGQIEGMLERRDDVDAFRFTATQTGTMSIDLDTGVFGNLDSYLTVQRDLDQAVVAWNDDYGSDTDSFLSFPVTAGYDYIISVSSTVAQSSGGYTLNLTPPDDPPQLEIRENSGNPDDLTLVFGDVMIGGEASDSLVITNVGSEDLVISNLTVTGDFYVARADQNDYQGGDLIVAPGEELPLEVVFDPDDIGLHNGTISFSSNDPQQGWVSLALTGSGIVSQPDITVRTESGESITGIVSFDPIHRSEEGRYLLTIENEGLESLEIYSIQSTDLFEVGEGFSGQVVTLGPGESLEVVISAGAEQRGHYSGEITIQSNDPDQPLTLIEVDVRVVGGVLSIEDSCGDSSDRQVDFGTVYLGEDATRSIILSNTGDADLVIRELTIEGDFQLVSLPGFSPGGDEIILEAGEVMEVEVGYTPDGWEEVSGTLSVMTDDGEAPISTIELQAEGRADALEVIECDGVEDGRTDAGEIWLENDRAIPLWQFVNHGNEPITISLSQTRGSYFTMAGPKTIIIEGGQSYTASVQLEAERAATVSDTLTYQADDYQGSQGSIEVTAAPFALVGGGRFYQFEDQTGDRVTIMVTGGGLAQVTLGATGQADIESIEFIAGTGNLPNMSSLMIMVAGGSTQLGRLAGEVNLSMLWAPQVELVGDGIEIEGDVNFLGLQRVASQARVHFAAETPAFLWIKEISEAGQIEVDGPVRLLLAEDFVGGSLRVDSLSLALVDDLDAEIEVADGGLDNLIVRQGDLNGAIQVNGSLGSVFVMRGDLLGDLNVEYDIDRIFLPSGTISGVIKSGRVIGNIYSSNMNRANVSAFDRIDRIDVQANMTESLVSVGSDVSNPSNQSAAAIRPGETYLGAIRVGGRYEASQVAVGVSPDMEGCFYPGVAGAIRGSIGTVNLSKVVFNNRENLFGIIAKDAVNSLQVNHQTIPTDYRQDDFIVAILNK